MPIWQIYGWFLVGAGVGLLLILLPVGILASYLSGLHGPLQIGLLAFTLLGAIAGLTVGPWMIRNGRK